MFAQKNESFIATAAVLTAPGAGAVAVIEIALPDTNDAAMVFQAFSAVPPRNLSDLTVGRIIYGRWDGEDVLVVRTAETCWEIHCHGGTIAIDRILADLRKVHVDVGPPPQQQPVRIDKSDTISAAIHRTLLNCRTGKTAGLALAQLDGRLHDLFDAVQCDNEARRNSARQHIKRWEKLADHLTRPWRIAIVGSPNVGKSSLINALAGLDRSIVSSTPGTTRDLVEVDIVVDGWTFQLVDTAGVRDSAASSLESIGIEKSLDALVDCDLVCVVIDVTDRQLQPALLKPLQDVSVPVTILFNKCDLICDDGTSLRTQNSNEIAISQFQAAAEFSVSALTGTGLSEFLQWMVRFLIPEEPNAATALPILAM